MGTYITNDQITFTDVVSFDNENAYNEVDLVSGMIRYNRTVDAFQGYHVNQDVDGNYWRPLTQNIATPTSYGVFKVGSNLMMNESNGYLSAISEGGTRIKQLIITVSPQPKGGDFNSINDAISNVVGTVEGGYRDGSLTQSSNLNAAPNHSNSFIILVAPGIYTESSQIVLPNYVSLLGEGKNQVIIQKTASSNENLDDSAVIKIGSNSSVNDVTIRMNPNSQSNICGIYAHSNSDISINNVLVEDTGANGCTNNCFGVYINSGSNILINNYETKFSLDSNSIYGLYSHNNKIEINDSKLNIEADSNSENFGVYLSNCNLIENRSLINNNFLNISGGTTNYGIYLSNSSCDVNYSSIDTVDETGGRSSYGIGFRGESSIAKIIINNIIGFVHSDSNNDTITSNDVSTVNFVSLGFTNGQALKITGASSSINNGYFTIFNVTSDTITLIEQDILETEAPSANLITLQELHLVNLSYSKINGTTNSLKSLDSNGSFQVNADYCILDGENSDLGSNNILFTHNHVITVANKGGDYQLLSSAINSIVHNSSKNRYQIRIMPGEYIEPQPFSLKQFVSICGSGKENTIITFNNKNSSLASGGGITLTSDIDIMNLTLKNITSGSNNETSFVLYGVGSSSSSKLNNIHFNNLKIISSGVASTQYGIYLKYCNYLSNNVDIDITGALSSSSNNYGWYLEESGSNSRSTDIQLKGGSAASKNVGILLKKSNINFYDSNINVQGSSTANYGIETTEETSENNLLQLFSGKIFAPGTSGTNNSILNGSTVTKYMCILNGIELNGETEDNSLSGRNLICHNCYTIGNNNLFKPINIRGQTDENTNNSLSIGYTAGKIDMLGDFNTFVGVNSGKSITSGDKNTFLGYNSGRDNTIGSENTFIGHNTGMNSVSSINNIAIGSNAGMHLTTAKDNIHIGRGSGLQNTSGINNITIGSNAGQVMTTGEKNILIGYKSGVNLTTAKDNIALGGNSGYNITTGSNNTIVGHSAGYNQSDASNVVLIGDKAGYNNTISENMMIGSYSGYNNTTGSDNLFMGYKSGFTNQNGSRNIYLGNKAGYKSTSAVNNVLIGSETGYNITSGSKNILIGSKTSENDSAQDSAGWSLTSGNLNVMIGSESGKNIDTAFNNILVGVSSGSSLENGSDNIMIGRSSGVGSGTSATQNIFIGSCSGVNATNSNNLFIGNNSGADSTGSDLILIGNRSGKSVNGDRNTFIGYQSGGLVSTSGSDNLCLGIHTGYNLSSGSRNIILGTGDTAISAGRQINTGSDNVLMGYHSGAALREGNENVFLGSNSGGKANCNKNIAIGSEAGESGQGDGNINIGYQSGKKQTSGIYNLNVGYQSGFNNTEGEYNLNLGYQSGYTGITNDNNIHIGYQAGYSSVANDNILLGYQSGYNINSVDASLNLFMGYKSGYNNTIGTNNIYLGSNVGFNNSRGSKNVFIGDNVGKGTSTYDVSNTILIGPNSGLNNTGNNNIFIGSSTDNSKGIGYQSTSTSVKNLFIGVDTGLEITNGIQNVGFGVNSFKNLTTGSNNSGFGINVGRDITTGSNNIVMGNEAGKTLETGNKNIIIGDETGSQIGLTASNNILIGENAGKTVNTSNIIAIGTNAGRENSTAENNFYIGKDAGKNNYSSNDNLIIGNEAGINLKEGDGKNIFIGTQTGYNNESGRNNLILGHNSFTSGTSTSNTIIIGNESGQNITSGLNNIGIGINNLFNNSIGNDNICIGYQTGYNLNSDNCILVGYKTGYNITTGDNNIGFGTESLLNTNTGSNNSAVGYNSLYHNTTGSNNVAFGYRSLYRNISRNDNFAIGYLAGEHFGEYETSDNLEGGNMYIGKEAGQYNNGSNNIFFGLRAGQSFAESVETNSASYNVGIGYSSLQSVTTGSNNVVIGDGCGTRLTTGVGNIITGTESGRGYTSGSYNIVNGHKAGEFNSEGSYNIHFGYFSGSKPEGYSGISSNNNISIGRETLMGDYLTGNAKFDNNIAIGNYAITDVRWNGVNNSNIIINNTVIGAQAGRICAGSNNTIIGYMAGKTCYGNNNVYIGSLSGHNNPFGSNNIFLSNNPSSGEEANLSTPLSNIFAVYQDNSLINTSGPLLYGNLSNNALVVNNNVFGLDGSTTKTVLFVNGSVEAQSYSSFTGIHIVNLEDEYDEVEEGMAMISTGVVNKENWLNTIVTVRKSEIEKDKKVYGIYAGNEIKGEGINSKKINKVASVGEGTMLVTNISGDIMNGDYICSSNIPGYGMKQDDDLVHNYTIAKSTQDVDWDSINDTIEWNGINYKKYLISCTYHCG